MPTATMKKYAEQSGKTVEEVEQLWKDCENSAEKKFKKKDGHFYAYVNTCTRNKLGLNKTDKKPKYSQW